MLADRAFATVWSVVKWAARVFPPVLMLALVLISSATLIGFAFGCAPHPSYPLWNTSELQDVKTMLEEIRLDLVHVHRLKTSTPYLRESMAFEESRRRQEMADMFGYQAEEVNRTSRHIEGLRQALERVNATRNTTVLTCDWEDVNRTAFSESNQDSKRGCHKEVDYDVGKRSLRSAAWGVGSIARPDYVNLDETQHFGCFDADGQPQGCHAFATKKVEKIQFRIGCASSDPRNWGWCGSFPWSQWSDPLMGIDSHAEVGCVTISSFFWSVVEWLRSVGTFYLFGSGSVVGLWYYASRAWTSINQAKRWGTQQFDKVLLDLADTFTHVQDLRERATGRHQQAFVNRVSLSLNLLSTLPPPERERGETQRK